MNLVSTLEAMVEAGASAEMVLAVVKRHEAEREAQARARRASEAERTARYRARGGGKIPPELRAAVLERDDYTCRECGAQERLECDHIHPLAKGGETTYENLQTLCRPCNARKRDRIRKAEVRGSPKMSADNNGQTGSPKEVHGGPEGAARTPTRSAQVVNPSSSLRSEEIPPPNPIGLGAPKGAETMRGSRLPDDWRPPESIDPHDFGMTDHEYADQAARFRDYWRAVPGAKGRKSDWPATWRNWLRRAADNRTQRRNERPDPLDKRTAREANHARALAGADIAARQRWEP